MSRLVELSDRFYDRIRHRRASDVVTAAPVEGFGHLERHSYAILATYRRDGTAVPTPMWFGLADGRFYTRTGASSWKVKRIRRDPTVRVAPATLRGRPKGPPAEGHARILGTPEEEARAEQALRDHYGLGRKLYEGGIEALNAPAVYIEVVPAETAARSPGPRDDQPRDA